MNTIRHVLTVACGLALAACSLDSRGLSPGEEEPGGDEPGAGADGAPSGSAGSRNGPGGGGSSQNELSAGAGRGEGSPSPGALVGDCADVEPLPRQIEESLRVGPGCVRIATTTISSDRGGTLTIEPGTTVLMEPGAYLNAAAELIAVGTPEAPIVFTSASLEPSPGDWECIRFGPNASGSRLEHVIVEYGGAPCGASGGSYEAALHIEAAIQAVRNVSVLESAGRAVRLDRGGEVRDFSNNRFARNAVPSIEANIDTVAALGTGNVFESEGDYIQIATSQTSLRSVGRWRNQGVPLRTNAFGLTPQADVVVEAGFRIEMLGGTIEPFLGRFDIEGTAEEPVVFTSANDRAVAGDWGCLWYNNPTDHPPRIDHAVFEYAGGGQGCTGARYRTVLFVPDDAIITNVSFRDIAGGAIRTPSRECPIEAWCANEFVSLEAPPIECGPSDRFTCD